MRNILSISVAVVRVTKTFVWKQNINTQHEQDTKIMKMSEELAKHGLYFDYLYNLRVLDPNISNETSDLKEKSGEYTESIYWIQFKLVIKFNFSWSVFN